MAEMESEPVPMSEEFTEEEDSRSESSHRSCCLSLRYSSSPFEGNSSASDEDDSQCGIVPYLYEPERESISESESGASSDDESREERLLNSV